MEFGVVQRPADGERVCGDAHRFITTPDRWLLCVVDGLGHGPAAAEAAAAACEHCEANAGSSLESLFVTLERPLIATRGAAVSILDLNPLTGRVRYAGIGNVELRCAGFKRFAPLTTPGIVGRRARAPIVCEDTLAPGDLVILMTDGVSTRFELHDYAHLSAAAVADKIIASHRKSHDDALCVALRVPPTVKQEP